MVKNNKKPKDLCSVYSITERRAQQLVKEYNDTKKYPELIISRRPKTYLSPEQEPNRKTTMATGTRSLRIVEAVIFKYHKRSGLDDLDKVLGKWVKGKTIVADTEFDAEDRFHQKVIGLGGKGIAPLRH